MKQRWVVSASLIITLALAIALFLRGREKSIAQTREAINTAKGHIERRDYSAAVDLLAPLVQSSPDQTEAAFLLGRCHAALKQDAQALQVWNSIPDHAPFHLEARLEQSRLEERIGSLRKAEEHARAVLRAPGPLRPAARRDLVRMLRAQGRFAEALTLQANGRSEAVDLKTWLRERYRLVAEPLATEGLTRYFDALASRPGRDDHVDLGRANVLILLDQLDEAHAILDRLNVDEPPVRLAKLRWAIAADRADLVRPLLQAFVPDDLTDPERVDLALWLASMQPTPAREYETLRTLGDRLPHRSRLVDRLSTLATLVGDKPRAEAYRLEKAQVEATRARFEDWIKQPSTSTTFDANKLSRGEGLGPEGELIALSSVLGPDGKPAASIARLYGPALDVLDQSAPKSAPRKAVVTPTFRDLADVSGLKFVHENGSGEGKRRRLIPPITASGGVALLDFDGDGRLDVYAVQGGAFPPGPPSTARADRLFHQRSNGTFEDVTERAGLGGFKGYGHGVAVGDFDNDGYPDLFITRWRSYALHRNRGDGTFEDVTEHAGLGGDRDWPTSAAFSDLDGDGDLDLYVCHYLKWDEHDRRPCIDANDPTIYNCSPRDFPALPDHLFRNDGGKFVDVTESAGIVDRDGRGLGVVSADLDSDGRLDLYVANDMSANLLFHNLGGMKFEEVALTSGAAANGSGGFQAGMGLACGDLDGDGLPDLAVTNFFNESTTFFHNLGGGFFGDETAAIGLAAPTRYLLGFGISFFDANNDGRLDLIIANGHVHDGRPQFPWKMPLSLLVNDGTGHLLDVGKSAGPAFAVERLGRGLAVGDIDNDGRSDVLILSQNAPLSYLHNETTPPGRSVTIELRGTASNRDAVGAVARAVVGGRTLTRFVVGGGSFQSASDRRIQIGLGEAEKIDKLEIRWPSGRTETLRNVSPGGYLLIEGTNKLTSLPAWNQHS